MRQLDVEAVGWASWRPENKHQGDAEQLIEGRRLNIEDLLAEATRLPVDLSMKLLLRRDVLFF
jgi:hypothetical protein